MRIGRVAFIAVLLFVMGACGVRSSTEVAVTVNVTVCPPNSSDCYSLRVPKANVQVRNIKAGEVKVGVTDERGELKLVLLGAGLYTVRATSFAMKEGFVEQQAKIDYRKTTIVNLVTAIAPYGP
jgi:hypothetical protein